MQTINVRELRNTIPHLRETLEREHELLLVSNGEPIARILPITKRPKLQSLKWLRDQMGGMQTDSTAMIREERDRRGT
ncbi:MAG: type II toxin-antitoxin system Phd/YefM family antitoxin [Polaromonas sp.]|uniref:type II toxin-antitoxin system Phd/YefM family antitoxin n=1 Tax=Polaromonas sp. TaxID=1869339 RepID=UPI002732CD24|nr:type II toxin-antitoxin system Phd/YefM family antitoxin [Polaromonas sp.]MDP2816858.1 type II toxin-antitoxin system Phd/YefM family antitoxin [Polaromonas sp.]